MKPESSDQAAATRASALTDLILFRRPIDDLRAMIGAIGWSETPAVVLTAENVLAVLRRFQAGALTAAEVEDWADLIECREDIDYLPDDEVLEAIYLLANPVLNGPLDEELTGQIVASLSA